MKESVIQDIAKKDFDCNLYAQRAITDEQFRSEIIELLDHPKIMVYYNSFYILEKATAMKPELFYDYFHTFASYLTHSNSYHRDFGLTLLANLVAVDTQKYFKDILIEYMTLLRDPKFMTAECCARQLTKIMEVTKEYHALIIKLLFDEFLELPYTEKQRALLMADYIGIVMAGYETMDVETQQIALEFVDKQCNSISPKTRKLAKAMKNKRKENV